MGVLDSLRGITRIFHQRGNAEAIATELDRAVALHEAGDLDGAQAVYRAILGVVPRHAEATHLLGLVAHQRGDHPQAVELIEAAIRADGARAVFHYNLGNARGAMDNAIGASQAYAEAVRLAPTHAAAWFNLGRARLEIGQVDLAEWAFRRAHENDPAMSIAAVQLAATLIGRADARSSVALPGASQGVEARLDEAIRLLEPHWPHVEDPRSARASLAGALVTRERFPEAVAHLDALLADTPDDAMLHELLANCHNQQGEMDLAVRHYREALRIETTRVAAWTSILGSLNYSATATPDEVADAHREWGVQASRGIARLPRAVRDASPDRPLRVAYISPDFRRHPVSYIFAPVLERHDPSQVLSYCYHAFNGEDTYTARLRGKASAWREVGGIDDMALADLLVRDRIDIAVDLAGHTTHNRLLALARRPAPVQASWLGYFNTTGLPAIDYFITDPHCSPDGSAAGSPAEQERWYVEKLARLPATRFVYEPSEYMPEPNSLPAGADGPVTFGCLNNAAKLNDAVLALWSRVLAAVPASRLLLQAGALSSDAGRTRMTDRLRHAGIDTARVELRPFATIDRAAFTYHDVDIALDPFPFCGGMTSFEALWMGVPVVTLPGPTVVSRQTHAMLVNLGMDGCSASSADAYVQAAASLAAERDKLSALRAGLRARFAASALADHAGFTRELEALYRRFWHAHLAAPA